MTITRGVQTASVYKIAGTDSYGQRTYGQTATTITIAVFFYSKEASESPNAIDTTVEGLTKASLTEGDKVVVGEKSYYVTKVIPGRYNQVFMRQI